MKKPYALQPGDKAAVVSLSRGMLGEPAFYHKFELAKHRLKAEFGLELVAMPNALKGTAYLDRHPEARAEDLMEAFRDPSIKAVFNAIGGDDTIRLLPYIDFEVLRQNPKIFTGFSDTTTNHFMMQKAGLVSYYGLSLMNQWSEYVAINPYTEAMIRNTLFMPVETLEIPCSEFCSYEPDKVWWGEDHMGESMPRFPNTGYHLLQGQGKVRGELLGGCADVFLELLGTPLWPDLEQWRGKLLLLETSEADMPADVFAWLLRNLQAQGILQVLNGIVFGKPAYAEAEEGYWKALKRVVGEEAGRQELPVLCNVNVGHAYPAGVLPLGLSYEIDCDRKSLTLLEPAAEPRI